MISALALLTGPEGPALARRVLAAGGVELGGAVIERRRVHHRPGTDTTASFAALVPGEPEALVLLTDADVAGRVVELVTQGVRLRGWVHPDDPRLPALATAVDPDALRGWLGAGAGTVDVELLSYRPLRRAVVRATTGEGRMYAKLWRPELAAAMLVRHRLLDAAGVGPHIVATPLPGVVVVADAEGDSLAEALASWNAGRTGLPEPAELVGLLDRLPDGLLRIPPRPAWCDRLDFHGDAAAAALPDQAAEITALATRLRGLLAGRPEGRPVPTHGDFYEANVFVAPYGALSLIDIDTAGPGRRIDDLACLLGHLAVLPDLSPAHYGRVAEVTYAWASDFESRVDAAELRARVAGVILSLVAGANRPHGLARLELCRSWLYRAEA